MEGLMQCTCNSVVFILKYLRQDLFLFVSSSFISKTFGTFLRGNLLTRMLSNVYWLCRTS